jgi:hypothetical protein
LIKSLIINNLTNQLNAFAIPINTLLPEANTTYRAHSDNLLLSKKNTLERAQPLAKVYRLKNVRNYWDFANTAGFRRNLVCRKSRP